MIHPQGAEVSSEGFTVPVVVSGGAVVVVETSVVVLLGGLLVVVLGGLLVVVVEGSAMAEDSEVAVLVVVVLAMGSLVELAIGSDAVGPPDPDPDPDPHPATTRIAMVRSPAIPTRRTILLLVRGILTSVSRVCHPHRNLPHRQPRIQGQGSSSTARRGSL